MKAITEELLQYSVTTSSIGSLEMEPVCLNEVLEESLAGFYGVFTSVGIVPRIRIPEIPVVRSLDRKALRRVFDNILSNASKYSIGDLEVELSCNGEVSFSNLAPDLDSVQTQRLFDKFFSIENARGSYGLGLSIARIRKYIVKAPSYRADGRLHQCNVQWWGPLRLCALLGAVPS